MAVFNGERYLQLQLNSISSQTVKPDKIVIVNDGSTDRSIKIIKQWQKFQKFEIIIHDFEINLGVQNAFCEHLEEISTDIILFCDQDDIWHSDKIKEIKFIFENYKAVDYVISNANLINENGVLLKKTLWEARKFKKNEIARFNAGQQLSVIIRNSITTGMVTGFKSKWLLKIPKIPKYINHDSWYLQNIATGGGCGKLCYNKLVYYRLHNQQLFGIKKSTDKKKPIIDSLVENINKREKCWDAILKKNNFMNGVNEKIILDYLIHLKNRKNFLIGNKSEKWKALRYLVFSGGYFKFENPKLFIIDVYYGTKNIGIS